MTIARSRLKVKVKVVGQAKAVGPTSIDGSLVSSYCVHSDLETKTARCLAQRAQR